MARKKTAKKKDKAVKEVVDQFPPKVTLYDNSFAFCLSNMTGIPEDIFDNIDFIIKNVGMANWYKPYVEVLKHHSYYPIFFSYRGTPLEVNEEKTLESYQFSQLPEGKCVILGRDSKLHFRCVVGLMRNERLTIVYDPNPSKDIAQIFEIGFLVNMFVRPEEYLSDGTAINVESN